MPISELFDPLAFKLMVYTALSTYLLTLMMPEPVTKGLAAVLTVYLVAYLGFGPVWSMVKAGWQLLEDSQRATTTEELKQAGHRFGRVLGDNGMRVFLLLATAAIGGKTNFVGRGPKLPGFGRAALASPARTGVSLEAVGQVKTVVLGAKEMVVGLAPTAVATTVMGPGADSNEPGRAVSNPQTGRFDTEHTGPRAFDMAREAAKKQAGDLGSKTQKMLEPETGTLIGERSADLKRGWRLEHDHFNWWDWSGGKKGQGGKFGHEFFPREQAGPHSKHIGYAQWE